MQGRAVEPVNTPQRIVIFSCVLSKGAFSLCLVLSLLSFAAAHPASGGKAYPKIITGNRLFSNEKQEHYLHSTNFIWLCSNALYYCGRGRSISNQRNLTRSRSPTGRTQYNLAGPLKDSSRKCFYESRISYPERRVNAKQKYFAFSRSCLGAWTGVSTW